MDDVDNFRSHRGGDKAYVRFINNTDRTVEVIWVNFTGSYVSYQLLERGRFIDINTYKRHPWIAIDHYTRDRLHIDKEFVYLPKTTKEYFQNLYPNRSIPDNYQARIRAIITLPVYSLRYMALLTIRNLFRVPEEADALELPKELINDLKKVINGRNNFVVRPLTRAL